MFEAIEARGAIVGARVIPVSAPEIENGVLVVSVPKQENYRPLVEVAQEQSVFEFHNVRGVMAGFYTPSFMASLNVPGIHLHFLSDDLTVGGHVRAPRTTPWWQLPSDCAPRPASSSMPWPSWASPSSPRTRVEPWSSQAPPAGFQRSRPNCSVPTAAPRCARRRRSHGAAPRPSVAVR